MISVAQSNLGEILDPKMGSAMVMLNLLVLVQASPVPATEKSLSII
jgi:hypothetical protein